LHKHWRPRRSHWPHDPLFFTSRLAGADAWRIFPHYRDRCAYLDIETTGLSDSCEITTIALYDGKTVRTYVNGRNLDTFPDDLDRYAVLITYNGRCFDIPMIERFFRIRVRQAQIDLRSVLARLGCRGGLKGCEKQLGINRGLLDGVDGDLRGHVVAGIRTLRQPGRAGDPARLQYRGHGQLGAAHGGGLQPLCRDDAVSRKKPGSCCPIPPLIPYQPDLQIMDRLRGLRS
jgi:uncharacterized protein